MELKQLEFFLTISRTKSFTRAAEQLFVSQPSITAGIKKLEEELGILLFDRSKKQITLTCEGEIFYRHIAIVMQDIAKATEKMTAIKDLSDGILNIGLSPLITLTAVSYLLAKFHNIHPALTFKFIEHSMQDLENLLEQEKIDMAFVFGANMSNNIEYTPLSSEILSVYLPLFHPFCKKSSLSPQELKNEVFILPTHDCGLRCLINKLFQEIQQEPHVSFETNYPQLIQNLITVGSGITILPTGLLDKSILKEIPLDHTDAILLYIAKKKDRMLSYPAQKLYDFLKNSYSA